MRVGIVTTSFPRFVGDHAGIFVYNMARHLVKSGIEVTVVAPHEQGTLYSETTDGIVVHRFIYMVPPHWQKLCYGTGILANIRQSRWVILQTPLLLLAALIKTWTSCAQCDVLHAYWSLPGLIAVVVGQLRGQPVILTTFGVEVFIHNRLNRLLNAWVLRRANAVIAISQYTRRRLQEIDSPRMCEVIPFGVDLEVESIPEAETKLRRRLGIPDGTKVVFALGRLVKRKGFDYLIQAMAQVMCHTPACLIIGGSGPCQEELLTQATTLNLQDVVYLPGFIPAKDLPLFYQGCHVFVLPSIEDAAGETEGLGMVLLEAQVYEKPIIGSDIGGIPDIIEDGKNGFLVESGDVEVLAERIITLLTNEALAWQMGLAGRERLERLFSWERVTSRVLETYKTVLNQSGGKNE